MQDIIAVELVQLFIYCGWALLLRFFAIHPMMAAGTLGLVISIITCVLLRVDKGRFQSVTLKPCSITNDRFKIEVGSLACVPSLKRADIAYMSYEAKVPDQHLYLPS